MVSHQSVPRHMLTVFSTGMHTRQDQNQWTRETTRSEIASDKPDGVDVLRNSRTVLVPLLPPVPPCALEIYGYCCTTGEFRSTRPKRLRKRSKHRKPGLVVNSFIAFRAFVSSELGELLDQPTLSQVVSLHWSTCTHKTSWSMFSTAYQLSQTTYDFSLWLRKEALTRCCKESWQHAGDGANDDVTSVCNLARDFGEPWTSPSCCSLPQRALSGGLRNQGATLQAASHQKSFNAFHELTNHGNVVRDLRFDPGYIPYQYFMADQVELTTIEDSWTKD